MAESLSKTSGRTKAYKPGGGSAGTTIDHPVIGIVKSTIDPTRTGRIQVYVQQYGGYDPNDSNGWFTVSYLSPFWGKTNPQGGASTEFGDYTNVPHSYGFWATPPDINTEVVCIFINGNTNQGYYLGCIPQTNLLSMTPAIGASSGVVPNNREAQTYGAATALPTAEINPVNTKLSGSAVAYDAPKAVHSYVAAIMNNQGVLTDTVRGPITSSAQRESPSAVYGISTPGRPIYKNGQDDVQTATQASTTRDASQYQVKARRGGHSFVMDDGEVSGKNQLIRLRSAAGHQITMSDDGETLFIMHANGLSWVELGSQGTIDAYAMNSINLRTQGDFNIHADQDINFHAGRNINAYADEKIQIQSVKDTEIRVGGNYRTQVMMNNILRVGGSTTLYSAKNMGLGSGSQMKLSGSRIDLNTSKVADPGEKTVPLLAKNSHNDTRQTGKGWLEYLNSVLSITSRLTTHQPFTAAGKQVAIAKPIQVNVASEAQTSPSTATATATAQSGNSPQVKASPAAIASAPSVSPVPPPVNVTPTVNNVAQLSSNSEGDASNISGLSSTQVNALGVPIQNSAERSSAADAQKLQVIGSGGTTINTEIPQAQGIASTTIQAAAAQRAAEVAAQPSLSYAGANVGIGPLGLNPQQLEAQGYLKPGSADLVTQNMLRGQTYQQASMGLTTTTSDITSPSVQVQAYGTLLAQSQSGLISSGVLKGTEPSNTILGMIKSGVDWGVKTTTNFVKSLGSGGTNLGSGLSNSGNTVLGNPSVSQITNTIAGGQYAGILASQAGNGAGLLDTIKSAASNTFNAVKSGIGKISSGISSAIGSITGKSISNPVQSAAMTPEGATRAIEASIPNLQGFVPNYLGSIGASVVPAELTPQERDRVLLDAQTKGVDPETALRNAGLSKKITQGIGFGPAGALATSTNVSVSTPFTVGSVIGQTSAPSFQTPVGLQGLVGGLGSMTGLNSGAGVVAASTLQGAPGITEIQNNINAIKANPALSYAGTAVSSGVNNSITASSSNPQTSTLTNTLSKLVPKQVGNLISGTISAIKNINIGAPLGSNATVGNIVSKLGSGISSGVKSALGVPEALIAKLKTMTKVNSQQGDVKAPVIAQGQINIGPLKNQIQGLITDGGNLGGIPLPQLNGEQIINLAQSSNLVSPSLFNENRDVEALRLNRDTKLEEYKAATQRRIYSNNPQDPLLVNAENDAKAIYIASNQAYEVAKTKLNQNVTSQFNQFIG